MQADQCLLVGLAACEHEPGNVPYTVYMKALALLVSRCLVVEPDLKNSFPHFEGPVILISFSVKIS